MSDPVCSIVVVTRDDPRVALTLEHLSALEAVRAGGAEVLVVDASAAGEASLFERFPDVRWLSFRGAPGQVTIAAQRNLGVRSARASVVVFLDAGCIPGQGWLERLTGPILLEDETLVAGSHLSAGGSGLRDQATHRLAGQRYLAEAPTLNLAVRRDVLEALGGFDERFAYGSDVDFTWRAVDAGHHIRHVPEARVSHDWGSPGAEARRSFVYGRARARLYLKHRRRWADLVRRDLDLPAYALFLLGLPLVARRPWLSLLLALPLWRNRGRRPVLTVADHLLYGAGGLIELGAAGWRRSARPSSNAG